MSVSKTDRQNDGPITNPAESPEDGNAAHAAHAAEARPASRRPRARKGQGLRLREEIMAATERLLLDTGSAAAVSIRGIAEAVGVTPPSIYRHFADKDTLVGEVCARHFAFLGAELDAAAAGLTDPVEQLIARGRAYIRFGLANPEPYRILFMTRLDRVPELKQQGWLAKSEIFAIVVANVAACVEAGLTRPEHSDPHRLGLTLWAAVNGLTSLIISKPFLELPDGFIDEYVATCVRGIVR